MIENNKAKEIGENPISELVEIGHSIVVEEHEYKSKNHRLECIYDDEPLGIEKNPLASAKRIQAQDPWEEIDLGDGTI